MYRQLRSTWSNNHANYISRFKETFPELSKINNEELSDRFMELKLEFYYEEVVPVKFWIRFTMPFAFLLMLLMIIGMPICFLVTGSWKYPLSDENVILNWFKALRILF